MKTVRNASAICLLAMSMAGTAMADLYIYPQKGQSQDQQDLDEVQCYRWAKEESGFDPMSTPQASAPAPTGQTRSGTMLKGGLGGAVVGGLLGGKKGAGYGAAAGGLIGGVHQHQHNKQVEADRASWERRETANYAANRDNYNRAFSACMESRGYTVR